MTNAAGVGRARRATPAILRAGALVVALGLAAAGCYTGSARDVSPRAIAAEAGWMVVANVPLVRQEAEMDCGAAALAMVLGYWSRPTSVAEISAAYPGGAQAGLKAGELRELARAKGLQAFIIAGTMNDLVTEVGRRHPVIVGLVRPFGNSRSLAHYEVVIGIHRDKRQVLTLDPGGGWRENDFEGFAREWLSAKQVALVIFPAGA